MTLKCVCVCVRKHGVMCAKEACHSSGCCVHDGVCVCLLRKQVCICRHAYVCALRKHDIQVCVCMCKHGVMCAKAKSG
jgi:hypothetical protein